MEDHVKNIEALLKENRVAGLDSEEEEDKGDDEEWDGIDDAAPAPAPPALEPVDHEEEYVDEDLYTTVKIEAVSIDRDGLHNKADLEAEDQDSEDETGEKKTNAKEGSDGKAKKSWKDQPKKKKKKFRYGTKLERQATNRKNNAGKGKPRA